MIVSLLLSLAALYLALGVLFAIAFQVKGLPVVDEDAAGSTIGFRIIIIPGVIIFWPFLLRKWIQVKKNHHHD